jgi:tetratricopeptide (TPR) repeat protein
LIHLGDPGKSLKLLDKIEKQINTGAFSFHKWRWQQRLLHARGLCFLALDEPAKALVLAEAGLTLAETSVIRKYVALNHELRGMALAKLGRVDEAIEATETAISLADAIQYQPIRWAGRQQLANLLRQNGCEQEAKNASFEAEHIIQTIANALKNASLRTIFLQATLPK